MTTFDTKGEEAKLTAAREAEEEDLARILSEKYGFEYADLHAAPIDAEALGVIPETDARTAGAAAFLKDGKRLSLAVTNPGNPALATLLEKLAVREFIVTRYFVSARSLEKALARYSELSHASQSHAGVFEIRAEELEKLSRELTSLAALKSHLTQAIAEKHADRVSRILEGLLAGALALNASDIHFEPGEDHVRLRLRLDGILTDLLDSDTPTFALLTSRIKLLSGLKLNISHRAQDGRFSTRRGDKDIEIRTSVIPDNYGDSIVLRILDPETIRRPFEEFGIHPKLFARLSEEIRRPNGMLLTTGPTGSGKTTTLYAFLRQIHTPEIKIITIEDPIEYHLPGIVQTQVDNKDYTFASGLRSALRQDPDVIMVGEIRDREVAETAIQAALTGHFVFSTLHTNNAAGTFPRLVDLGVDSASFPSAITVAMAQRLIRTLDPETRVKRRATKEEKRLIDRVLSGIVDRSLIPEVTDQVFDPTPGTAGETGYKGRMGIHEAIFMDEALGSFLRGNPSEGEIAKEAKRQGFLTMTEDGVLKVLRGATSLAEVVRVAELPRE